VPAYAYPEDFEQTVAPAMRDHQSRYEPPLAAGGGSACIQDVPADTRLVLQADQERETLARVTRWLGGMRTPN
jgi:hypothetical protein